MTLDSPPLTESYERSYDDQRSSCGRAQSRPQDLAVNVAACSVVGAAAAVGQGRLA